MGSLWPWLCRDRGCPHMVLMLYCAQEAQRAGRRQTGGGRGRPVSAAWQWGLLWRPLCWPCAARAELAQALLKSLALALIRGHRGYRCKGSRFWDSVLAVPVTGSSMRG